MPIDLTKGPNTSEPLTRDYDADRVRPTLEDEANQARLDAAKQAKLKDGQDWLDDDADEYRGLMNQASKALKSNADEVDEWDGWHPNEDLSGH